VSLTTVGGAGVVVKGPRAIIRLNGLITVVEELVDSALEPLGSFLLTSIGKVRRDIVLTAIFVELNT
jgi:hypothetical protein